MEGVLEGANLVTLNVRGRTICVDRETLLSHPGTKLYELAHETLLRPTSKPIYFNRNSEIVESVIDYYVTGQLHVPKSMCMETVYNELEFWQLDRSNLASCCKARIVAEQDSFRREAGNEIMAAIGEKCEYIKLVKTGKLSVSWPERLRLFLEEPSSSVAARAFSIWTLFMVIVSFVVLILSVEPEYRESSPYYHISNANLTGMGPKMRYLIRTHPFILLTKMEGTLLAYFTINFIARLTLSQSKKEFFLGLTNWMECVSLIFMWSYILMRIYSMYFLITVRFRKIMFVVALSTTLRVVYLVRAVEKLEGFKLIGLAVRQSKKQLLLLAALIGVMSIVLGHLYYFVEVFYENADNIPTSIWWAFITMTTVGYGDFSPTSYYGYCVGIFTAYAGLLLFAMVIPVIAKNFNIYYEGLELRKQISSEFLKK